MKERLNELKKDWMNERMNEWMTLDDSWWLWMTIGYSWCSFVNDLLMFWGFGH